MLKSILNLFKKSHRPRSNKREDGCCFNCNQETQPNDLHYCHYCKNYFCPNCITWTRNPQWIEQDRAGWESCFKDKGKYVSYYTPVIR